MVEEDEFMKFTNLLVSGDLQETKDEVVVKLRTLATELDTKQRDMNIAKTSFATTGIIGTGLAIAGVIAAPFTFGTSMGLTIAGAAVGVSSGLGGLATAIADHIVNSKAMKEAEAAIDVYMKKVTEMLDMVSVLMYTSSSDMDDDASLNENFKEQMKLIPKDKDRKRVEVFLRGLRTGVDAGGQAAHLGASFANVAGRTTMSTLGTGLKVVRIGGVVLSVLTLPLDLHTLITNSIKIHRNQPSMVAEQIREMAHILDQHEILDDDNDY